MLEIEVNDHKDTQKDFRQLQKDGRPIKNKKCKQKSGAGRPLRDDKEINADSDFLLSFSLYLKTHFHYLSYLITYLLCFPFSQPNQILHIFQDYTAKQDYI